MTPNLPEYTEGREMVCLRFDGRDCDALIARLQARIFGVFGPFGVLGGSIRRDVRATVSSATSQ